MCHSSSDVVPVCASALSSAGGTGFPALQQQHILSFVIGAALQATGAVSSRLSPVDGSGSNTSRMSGMSAADMTDGFIVHIDMKSLVLVVPPNAAAITQRVLSRSVYQAPARVRRFACKAVKSSCDTLLGSWAKVLHVIIMANDAGCAVLVLW